MTPDRSAAVPGRSFLRILACFALLALAPGLPFTTRAADDAGDEVWITLDREAYATASWLLPLPRLGEAEGVVLTRIPSVRVAELSQRLHTELARCGGFMAHQSLADGQAELARVASLERRTEGTLPFAIDQPAWVAQVAGAVDEAQILATVTTLSTGFPNRYHAHASGTSSANWIKNLWAGYAAGRPEVTVELVTHPAGVTPQPSVVLTIPGTSLADQIIVLGAHQDSISSGCSGNPSCNAPGADDDASGVATLSEVVRVVLASGFAPQRTVRVMAYAAEEVGLRGSNDLAAAYQTAGANVVAVLQQDMTGYHGSAEDVAFISDWTNATLTAFLVDLLETYQPGLLWTSATCGYACSDHAPWHNRGYPAAFAFEARFGQYNPTIHTTSDTVATLGNSAAHAAKFARLAAAFLVETSLDSNSTLFTDGFESGDTSAWGLVVP
ncbi:MAG TPA: M20/M25/M40 family metallo-hydrolase [Thermoanaerobaculia bacterium]|nr:M20/M25/M40 family metallo-hydrolase [Thermoanaerobaculia bacterium]